ncbi:MAG: hypothetical protein MI921_17875 [Cytophagales bacterium]|nr:hypothetical protein [Cytophagales bacterium]
MRKKVRTYCFLSGLVVFPFLFIYLSNNEKKRVNLFIKGVNLEAPPSPFDSMALKNIKDIQANWISIIPYAFTSTESPRFYFDGKRQWWGEKSEGVVASVEMAQQLGLSVMIKPHLWVKGQGWAGDFVPDDEEKWLIWEESYQKYMLNYAKIAAKYQVPLLCIGTECRKSAISRSFFWKNLIARVREIYPGQLTYAANWDNYRHITFWDQLDFIGIDAYFPLGNQKTPSVSQLNEYWKQPYEEIRQLSKKVDKPVIFTEYGYKSIDYATIGHWKVNPDTLSVNMDGQLNAYESIYQTFWYEPWFKGGFLWKWHIYESGKRRNVNSGFTPQNKPVIQVIQKWFRDAQPKKKKQWSG